jgi:hypothetical protein
MSTNTERLPEAVQWLLADRDAQTVTCGCTGQCGHHPQRRCDTDGPAGLTVAPADLTIPVEQAAALPAEQLIVWCRHCRDLAETVARRRRLEWLEQQTAAAQLGLWGAL